jgi:hypothetical protein
VERVKKTVGGRVFRSFGALSFNVGRVTGASTPTPGAAQPRPTPESVSDLNVHKNGSANSDLPQPAFPGATRYRAPAK